MSLKKEKLLFSREEEGLEGVFGTIDSLRPAEFIDDTDDTPDPQPYPQPTYPQSNQPKILKKFILSSNSMDGATIISSSLGINKPPNFGAEKIQSCRFSGVLKCVVCDKIFADKKDKDKFLRYDGELNLKQRMEAKAGMTDYGICFNCKSQLTRCKACEGFFKPEELKFEHCSRCIKQAPSHYIFNYSYRVENNLGFRGTSKDELFYGTELEFESENIGLDTLIVNSLLGEKDNPSTLIGVLKKDSSIAQGFEIVSVPATIDEHYQMWNVFFEKLPPTCKPSYTCGMHVHVSKAYMSDLHVGKILTFLHSEANREFIRLCAGRDSSFHNDFEKPKSIKDSRMKGSDRHTALNLNNENTIEFRIFASTKDKRIFLKNIEFCRAIVKFTDTAHRSMTEAVDYRKFMDFIFQYRKEYEYLALFFETKMFSRLYERAR